MAIRRCVRRVTLQGITYNPGDMVDTSGLRRGMEQKLVDQRRLSSETYDADTPTPTPAPEPPSPNKLRLDMQQQVEDGVITAAPDDVEDKGEPPAVFDVETASHKELLAYAEAHNVDLTGVKKTAKLPVKEAVQAHLAAELEKLEVGTNPSEPPAGDPEEAALTTLDQMPDEALMALAEEHGVEFTDDREVLVAALAAALAEKDDDEDGEG